MKFHGHYDVIVVGGGHAGTEAALAAARSGVQTLLLTHNIDTVGLMSCNPAIGGIGKGHLVKEIDALGGVMAYAADCAGIHFRTLNSHKGPAVRATRAQTDRDLYRMAVRGTVEQQANLFVMQQAVDNILFKQDQCIGVVTQLGLKFNAAAVVLTAGTFLQGKIHIGTKNYSSGRAGAPATITLANQLREKNFRVGRLKTGTPPRIDGSSIDLAQLEEQCSEDPRPIFSFIGRHDQHPRQKSCYITQTNQETHEIISDALHHSPCYNGTITSESPRYCPSIEDKVTRFAEKTSHRIFIEPEGLDTTEIYPNGISTNLPYEFQLAMVRSIKGFENAHITRPGYAIEYDYFDPLNLFMSLETRTVAGLFFAGQINGTTGYEEAAAQGIVAGVNASQRAQGLEPWIPKRSESYIGVMLDDLTTRGTTEPYRMFTSRSEYRLLLREDNADLRLTPIGRRLNIVNDDRWRAFSHKREILTTEQERLRKRLINSDEIKQVREKLGCQIQQPCSAMNLLGQHGVHYADVAKIVALDTPITNRQAIQQIEIQAHYSGYLVRQEKEINRLKKMTSKPIPNDINYHRIPGLSNEVREKLLRFRPQTIGQAGRIPGLTPAAISLLLVHLKHKAHSEEVRSC